MNKVTNKLEVLTEKISDKHNDSFWYDGVIATKGDYTLIACGDIKIYEYDKYGLYKGLYDGKARDDFYKPKNDKELEKCYNNENGYVMDMNNWFEILDSDDETVADIYGNYDDALEALKELTQ